MIPTKKCFNTQKGVKQSFEKVCYDPFFFSRQHNADAKKRNHSTKIYFF
jgi:hypothetical protein